MPESSATTSKASKDRHATPSVAQERDARLQDWLSSLPPPPLNTPPVRRRSRPQPQDTLTQLSRNLQSLALPTREHATPTPPPPPPPPPSSTTSNRFSSSPVTTSPIINKPPTPPPVPNIVPPSTNFKTPPPPPPIAPPPLSPPRPRPPNYAPPHPVRPSASRPPPPPPQQRGTRAPAERGALPPPRVTPPPAKQSSQPRLATTRSRMEKEEARISRPPSTRVPSTAFGRMPSERIAAIPSDLGLGERVVSEHFGRVASGSVTAATLLRNDSAASGVGGAGNPLAALKMTFMSVRSYGNTEKSSGSLGEDANVGYKMLWSSSDKGLGGAGSFAQFRSTWSSAGLGLPTRVEEAAGALYRSGSIDDHWVFKDRLGEGAFSEVRLGEGRYGEGFVAIKIVSKGAPDLFCPSGSCREVVACKMMGQHPNIVKCLHVYEDDRFIYLVMELLMGGQMLPRIADVHFYPRYCENDVVTLVRCLTRALAHLHRIGIAHRDVKPENILYASDTLDPTVKLTDFGIAHTTCDTCPAEDMVGTPLYVAPEVLLRQPYGCAADMWSLGVIVHILLTGYPPFDDDDLVQLINKVKHKPLKMLGEEWVVISEDARDFVQKLLTRDVTKRLSADGALSHPWLATPRPPPFPAPPVPSKALNPPAKVEIPPTKQSKQDGTIPLMVAQVNLNSFVVRKEWKRMVESENSDRNLKLSMLVSLSEKDLGDTGTGGTSRGKGDKDASFDTAHNKDNADGKSLTKGKQAGAQAISAGRPPKATGPAKREKPSSSRETSDLEPQQERERLRRQRLLVEADIAKKNKLKAKKVEESSERTPSMSTGTLSSPCTSDHKDAPSDAMMTNSKFSDESSVLSDAFQSRRDADAEDDVEKIQRQRKDTEQLPKQRGALIGRRARQSNSTKQSVKSEKTKPAKAKNRARKKQKHTVPLLPGARLINR